MGRPASLDPADHMILSLDLGTTTGWALRTSCGQVHTGSKSFQHDRYSGGGMRFLRFSSWLNELGPVSLIWFEEVRRHTGTDAAHVYGGLMGTLTAWAEHHEIPYEGVPVGTIKKFATGKGNASKEDMIKYCRSRNLNPVDDNEADAICLLHWAVETHGGTI